MTRFGMADHDEMTGTSAWNDWQRRREQWIDDFAWLLCAPIEAPAPPPPPPPAAASASAMLARPARRLTLTGDPRNGPVKLTPEQPEVDPALARFGRDALAAMLRCHVDPVTARTMRATMGRR